MPRWSLTIAEGEARPTLRERLRLGVFLWRHLGGLRGFLWQAAVMMLLMAIVNLPLPLLNKVGLDAMIPAGERWSLLALAAFAFGVRAVASVFQVFQNHVVRRVMAGLAHNLRHHQFRAILHGPYADFVSGAMSERVGRVTTDVSQVERMVFDTICFSLRPLCMIVVMLGVMLAIDWQLTLVLGTVAPLCMAAYIRLDNSCDTLEEQVLAQRQELQHRVADCFDNIRAIRCFAREERYQGRIQEGIARFTDASVRLTVQRQWLRALIDVILLLPWLAVILVGGVLVQRGSITLGDLMAFSAFEQLLRSPLAQFSWYCTQTQAMFVSARRVQEVCALEDERIGGEAPAQLRGELELRDLRFAYLPGQPVLQGIDLHIAPGERIAIVGASGGGKSTLINLLLGFYRPSEGEIIFDGIPSRELDSDALRGLIGCVFQDNPMFDGTLRENVDLFGTRDDEAILAALAQAEAGDFLRELPAGLDTRIGVKGLKLSGGQRQRIAIARVILKDPALVLLDEATSSLDSVTENRIRSALDRLLSRRTSITIAHRLSTVVASDRICYLEAGRIVEEGSHEALLARGGRYAELFAAQVDGLLDARRASPQTPPADRL